MKKWEAVELQNFPIEFILKIDKNGNYIFTSMTLGIFLQPLKDLKEHWILENI